MMKALARPGLPEDVRLVLADVTTRSGNDFRIRCLGTAVAARRAAGCVMEPEPGDRVLAAVAEREAFIVEVMERHSDRPARWSADGDLDLSVAGSLSVSGRAVAVDGAEEVTLRSPRLAMQAWSAALEFMETAWTGRRATVSLESMRAALDAADLTAGRLMTRARRVFRRIAEFEETRAGRLRWLVEGRWSLRSREAAVRAERAIDLDAEKIHLG